MSWHAELSRLRFLVYIASISRQLSIDRLRASEIRHVACMLQHTFRDVATPDTHGRQTDGAIFTCFGRAFGFGQHGECELAESGCFLRQKDNYINTRLVVQNISSSYSIESANNRLQQQSSTATHPVPPQVL